MNGLGGSFFGVVTFFVDVAIVINNFIQCTVFILWCQCSSVPKSSGVLSNLTARMSSAMICPFSSNISG